MKKTYKGLTLVEVLVSIAVFTIISLAMFSSLLAMTKVVALQEDYARIEMVCYDINAYWDMYGDNNLAEGDHTNVWYKKYFGDDAKIENGKGKAFLLLDGNQFIGTTQPTDYKITYEYDNSNNLIITSIYSTSKNREYLNVPVNCEASKKEVSQ